MTLALCPANVCRAGALGNQLPGSLFFAAKEVGVALSNSDCNAAFRASSSKIFFWRRTTDVHFFSRKPAYFLAVVSSKVVGRASSVRRAEAEVGRLAMVR